MGLNKVYVNVFIQGLEAFSFYFCHIFIFFERFFTSMVKIDWFGLI